MKESQNSLCKILEELEVSFLIFTDRLREDLLTKMPLLKFFNKTNLAFWKYSYNTTNAIQKRFPKHIKYSKIFLGLTNKQMSIHITFEHVQLYK